MSKLQINLTVEQLAAKISEYLYTRDDVLDMNDVDNLSENIAKKILS